MEVTNRARESLQKVFAGGKRLKSCSSLLVVVVMDAEVDSMENV